MAAGGRLAPGNSLGTLTISNNLSLASGGLTQIQVQHSPLTNNTIKAYGTLAAGGTLLVTNSGGTAFAAGDSFKLFSAGGYVGSFDTFSLPALNSGLFWSISRLMVDGTIGVVSSNPPAISAAKLSGTNLVLQGTGGTPNWSYSILCSTNLVLPLAQWTATATNFFNAGGNFTWTNATSANGLRQFYVIRVQ